VRGELEEVRAQSLNGGESDEGCKGRTRKGCEESKRVSVQTGQVLRSRHLWVANSERCMQVLQSIQWQASTPKPSPTRQRLQKGQW
jgi:hypothetical protein